MCVLGPHDTNPSQNFDLVSFCGQSMSVFCIPPSGLISATSRGNGDPRKSMPMITVMKSYIFLLLFDGNLKSIPNCDDPVLVCTPVLTAP